MAEFSDEFPGLTPVQPEPMRIAGASVADLSLKPNGPRARQLLYGHRFEVLERRDGLAFGYAPLIAHAGWVDQRYLASVADPGAKCQRVVTRLTHAYTSADLKSGDLRALPHNALLTTGDVVGEFTQTDAGWVPSSHLTDANETDVVSVAARYLGAPYLWGGNSSLGIDCSGLVQAAAIAAGIQCPADSDQQMNHFADPTAQGDFAAAELLFWRGHVAIAMNSRVLIHANAHNMATVTEPIEDALKRIERTETGPLLARGSLRKPGTLR